MARETVQEKARRLLTEGRLMLVEVGRPEKGQRIIAQCRGDSGTMHLLGWDPEKNEWRCNCEARTEECSHLIALKLVAVKPLNPAEYQFQ